MRLWAGCALNGPVKFALLFIQKTVKQDDGCSHFVGRDLQTGSVDRGGNGLAAAPGESLALASGQIDGRVEEQAGDQFTGDSVLPDELPQSVLHFNVQDVGEFFGKHACGRSIDERFGGGEQRTVAGEPGRITGPQAIRAKTSNLTKGVETTAVRIARHIVKFLEFPKHGEIDVGTEGALQVGSVAILSRSSSFRRASEEKEGGLIML